MSLLLLFNSASDPPPPELVLNAVLELGDAKAEGMLVEAVAIPWFVILDRIRDDPGAAHQIPPRVWEEIIAGAYTRAGFDEVILTPRSGDNRIRSELVVRVGY